MRQIDNISADAKQTVDIDLEGGQTLTIDLLYAPAVQRWYMSPSVQLTSTKKWAKSGLGIAQHPNLLRQWRNGIRFGIGCSSTDGADPVDVTDFQTGRCKLYLLDSADVDAAESQIFQAVS